MFTLVIFAKFNNYYFENIKNTANREWGGHMAY